MEDELVNKINSIILNHNNISEDNIRSMMILIRKLLDKMKKSNIDDLLVLRLFCNWTAHNEITDSNTGLRVLAEINDTLVNLRKSTNPEEIQTKMSNAIGFPVLRKELKIFYSRFYINDLIVTDNNIWGKYLINLIEIIKDVPLSFPDLSKLEKSRLKIYNRIAKNPIKPGAGVISMQISKINYGNYKGKELGEKMCLMVRTEDTTTLIIPLSIDVRL